MKAQVIRTRARRAPSAVPSIQWKPFLLGAGSACALIALIFTLDRLAAPDDISAGTALAAVTPAARSVVLASESWAADASAQGTRPDAVH